ncbi:hypothetical protein [Peribacillus frigoritolerans]|jgi:hypothetical protein|nr:hypothetical protein [Peribacillus frigoritolerans]MCR8871380.1 hypothetical protein [Peribacillus frigoritolerans]
MEAYMLLLVPYSRYEAVMTVWRELSYLYKSPSRGRSSMNHNKQE